MIRRRNYFIKKRFQTNFILKFILLLLLEAVLIAGLFMYISSNTLTTGYFDSILTIEKTPHFFGMPFLLITLIVGIGIGLAGMVVFILLSHRIAGPLYRFEQDLQEISSGDLTKRINLRKTDQLTELQKALNALVESLDRRMSQIKNSLVEIEDLLSRREDPETILKLKKAIGSLKEKIESFKVTSSFKE